MHYVLSFLALILFGGAVFEAASNSDVDLEIKPDHYMVPENPVGYVVTADDVAQMMQCSAYLVNVAQQFEIDGKQDADKVDEIAKGWLRTALFFAPTVAEEYVTFLRDQAVISKMAAENLLGETGIDGLIRQLFFDCSELNTIKNEIVKFLGDQGNE